MRKISDTIGRLESFRVRSGTTTTSPDNGGLTPLENFGTNPGALGAWTHVPQTAKVPIPLVVVLHGCTQNARDYNRGAGWSQLADELGFAVLLPEQRRANNFNLCFNWYEASDNRRDIGEAASIKQMVDCMIEKHGIDPSRVFINGLSAGGAMTSVMLATYPETFAAGAIIAGLPYGSANGVPEAFDRMRGHGGPDGPGLAQLVRAAAPANGRWPTISVWHGDADYTVAASNGDNIIEQWRPLHEVSDAPDVVETVNGYPHRIWLDPNGRAAIRDYRITGMGHGTPLATMGDEACGVSGAHMLEVAISSTRRIASDWGLGRADGRKTKPALDTTRNTFGSPRKQTGPGNTSTAELTPTTAGRVTKIIEDALRSAGLM
ncbi:MAG: PHB depolymerase family esterase [Sphingomonas sp.]